MKRSTLFQIAFCMVSLFLLQDSTASVLYVDGSAPAAGDGQSWATAYRFLQDTLVAAAPDDEIWVAAGIYKPDQSEANPVGTSLQTDKFELRNGIGLRGGFAGDEDPQTFPLEHRDFEKNETILSGDLLGNDNHSLTGVDLLNDPNRSENSYHIFKGVGITDSTFIDGFTITGGHARGAGEDNKGAGLLNSNNSNPRISHCLFIRNTADYGACMYNYRSSSRTDRTRFINNASAVTGGAIHNGISLVEMKITCSVFENCFSEGWGGAIYNNNDASLRLEYCRLVNNKVWKLGNTRGGAVANQDDSQMTCTFCTIAGNIADNEGGAIRNDNSTLALDHSILWDNEDESGKTQSAQIHNLNGTVSLAYTCLMGWDGSLGGAGNLGLNPLFVNLPVGNVHLQSTAGHWDEGIQGWITDAQTSPCIDAGDPSLFVAEEPIGNGGRINIGVYGGTAEASKTDICIGGIDGAGRLISDVNRDCRVNLKDFFWLASEWLMSTVQ